METPIGSMKLNLDLSNKDYKASTSSEIGLESLEIKLSILKASEEKLNDAYAKNDSAMVRAIAEIIKGY